MLRHWKSQLNPASCTALQAGSFVSRIFTDQLGQSFRLTFFVTIVDGEARGHLVSAQPVAGNTRLALAGTCATSQFCLPTSCAQNATETVYIPAYAPIVSPFNTLFFFTSQPTRAPSHN
jgi:hypothetical protein